MWRVTQQILLIFWVCNSFRSWLQVFNPSLYLYLFPWDCISSNAKKSTFLESGPVLWIALPNGMQQKWQQCALSEPASKKAPCFCQEKSTGLVGWAMRDTVSSAPDLWESPGDTNSKAVLVDNPRYQVINAQFWRLLMSCGGYAVPLWQGITNMGQQISK